MKLYIIHKPGATERESDIKRNLAAYDYEFVTPVLPHNGQLSLMRTHKELIRMADRMGLTYIVVCEDDLQPTKHLPELQQYINEANILGADVLLGGVTHSLHAKKTKNQKLIKAGDFDGTHLTVYFNRMFKRVDELDENFNVCISPAIRRAGFNTVIARPFLAMQKHYKDSMCHRLDCFNFSDTDLINTIID